MSRIGSLVLSDRRTDPDDDGECSACGAAPLGGPRDAQTLCADCAEQLAEQERADDDRARLLDEQRYAESYERAHGPGRA